jgi:predicted helicase
VAQNKPSTPPPATAKPLKHRDTAYGDAPHVDARPANDTAVATPHSSLHELLETYRQAAATNREAGTYFEELTLVYLKTEPAYKELYREVLTHAAWAERAGIDKRDDGIDLVAETFGGEVHAIQCKLYPADYRVQKPDIDSFFTASGKKPFSRRLIFATTNLWSHHAENAMRDQQPPVTKIDLNALEQSIINWAAFKPKKAPTVRAKKSPRAHQRKACEAVVRGLQKGARGKLIMACGTGKTFTSLKIAEALAGGGKRVLFLVPSLALLSQTLTEWTQESEVRLRNFAVCSDSDVGKKRTKDNDTVQTFVHELQFPATTSAVGLAREVRKLHDAAHMTVVYATYHSIEVIHKAQKEHGLPAFDLIVCDEAHRTTGAKFEGMDESPFVRIHDAAYVTGKKRVYMTATPRIYGEVAKLAAEKGKVALASMDDESLYGPQLYLLTFSDAVKQDLLVDYKVIVLAVDERHVSDRLQTLLKDENNQLRIDDAAKIVGCWKALGKLGLAESLSGEEPMKRAVAFCQVIERQRGSKVHKVSSKHVAEMFQAVVEAYQQTAPDEDGTAPRLFCESEHVDGSMNASEKEAKIAWLKANTPDNTCRILSNVRCLSEGVDVPALDAVLFLTPRSSQIDVVQSVGRVMRKSPGKKRGYIVLPVVIPAGMDPEQALHDNQVYRVVWQVLQALRSHDDRFDAMINKLSLIGKEPSKMEIIAVTDKVAPARPHRESIANQKQSAARRRAQAGRNIGAGSLAPAPEQPELKFNIGEMERAIYARLVEKVGNRHHWEDWAKDIAKIANTHITRIQSILSNKKNVSERDAFDQFARELRNELNDQITDSEIVEMLAQHLVTKPVFDALFEGHDFVSQNSMSRAMQGVLHALQEHHIEKEAGTLAAFYESVKLRAEGIDSAEGKQRIVVELYDKFFRNAFPQMSERLGIVYTPVEIVDFILKSVEHLLRVEFGQTLGSEGVHILDPFTGTGTFITRLLQSGLLSKAEVSRKYRHEIHANEIVLLAYYIAAINIELAYHGVAGGAYEPFDGICLADTFQLYEKDDGTSRVLVDNSARRKRQKKLDIRVIISNPPYSVGQESQNDNNQNVKYPLLDARIAATYAARSSATNRISLYDSYVRAIRWASDRVGQSGIVGFVTNASFIDGAANGLRKCLAEEFSSLYIFHLRGNQRTAGERSKKEGGKIFGSGSRAPVAISLLVKNSNATKHGQIFFRDVGDHLTREQKLAAVSTYGSVAGITEANGWTRITPDTHGDWLRQRDSSFARFMVVGDKKGDEPTLFAKYSNGVKTQRDAWAYGPSKRSLVENMSRMIATYNKEVKRFHAAHRALDNKAREAELDGFIDTDPRKIAWTRALKADLAKGTRLAFDETKIVPSLYRPFSKEWLYFDRKLNELVLQNPRFFPSPDAENRVIGVSAGESRSGYSVLMADVVPSLHAVDMVGSQFFPLYIYDTEVADETDEILSSKRSAGPSTPPRRDGMTDAGRDHFQLAYPSKKITKEDVFYYIYGVLHSQDYRERYADNLGKELPRIPRVKTAAQFWEFSRAGRALGDLHVGYEQVTEYPGVAIDGPAKPTGAQYRVEKMRFGRSEGGTKDKAVIHFNAFLTVRDVPPEAYEYVVNGKSAIEWVMESQCVTTEKDSGIIKDANAWATETSGDSRYPLSLLLRVITVSLETMKIVRSLPTLDILEETTA